MFKATKLILAATAGSLLATSALAASPAPFSYGESPYAQQGSADDQPYGPYETYQPTPLSGHVAPAPSQPYPMSVAPANDQGVSFISGGIGKTERAYLEQNEQAYNLKVESSITSGHYIGDVNLRLKDRAGNVLVNTVTDGPLFYAQLKPGTYTIEADYNGQVKTQQVTVGKQALREVHLTWPGHDNIAI